MKHSCRCVILLSFLIMSGSSLILFGCNDSTGPSDTYKTGVMVISTASSSITAYYDLIDVDCENLVVSPDGNSLYISGF